MVSSHPSLTLAVADHDLNRPLIDGTVRADDLALQIVWDREDGQRHAQMLQGAFDACEFSFANYLVLRSRNHPFSGIPVFPNRKFCHSYVVCHTGSGIWPPYFAPRNPV